MSRRAKERYLDGTHLMSRVSAHGYRGVVKSIQQRTVSFTGTTSGTDTITAVDLNNSVIHYLGASTVSGGSGAGFVNIVLTNSTTVTATTAFNATTMVVSYVVIEFYPGLIKSVQRGTITTAGVTSNTATINAVNTSKSVVDFLGNVTSDNVSGNSTAWDTRLALTSSTIVTATVGSNSTTQVTSFQVVEYY